MPERRFPLHEVLNACVRMIDLHCSRGAPDFDFLLVAVGLDLNSNGTTNDPAAWSDWLECLYAADGITWDPPQEEPELWRDHSVRTRDGFEVDVRLSQFGNSEWPDYVPAGPANGLTERAALDLFDAILTRYAFAEERDLARVREYLLQQMSLL